MADVFAFESMAYPQKTMSQVITSSNNYCKSIIISFITFRHRTMFYRAKTKLKRGVRINLDLTKSRYDLLKRANDHAKEVPSHGYKFSSEGKTNDENHTEFWVIFFCSFSDLLDIVDIEI